VCHFLEPGDVKNAVGLLRRQLVQQMEHTYRNKNEDFAAWYSLSTDVGDTPVPSLEQYLLRLSRWTTWLNDGEIIEISRLLNRDLTIISYRRDTSVVSKYTISAGSTSLDPVVVIYDMNYNHYHCLCGTPQADNRLSTEQESLRMNLVR
jgi:hypothetical protein